MSEGPQENRIYFHDYDSCSKIPSKSAHNYCHKPCLAFYFWALCLKRPQILVLKLLMPYRHKHADTVCICLGLIPLIAILPCPWYTRRHCHLWCHIKNVLIASRSHTDSTAGARAASISEPACFKSRKSLPGQFATLYRHTWPPRPLITIFSSLGQGPLISTSNKIFMNIWSIGWPGQRCGNWRYA